MYPQKPFLNNKTVSNTATARTMLLITILGTNPPVAMKVINDSNPPNGQSASTEAATFPPKMKCLIENTVNMIRNNTNMKYLMNVSFLYFIPETKN